MLLTSSRVGESDYQPTLKFLSMIRPPMHGYGLILPVGGHNFRTWKREIGQALDWLSQRLAAGGTADPLRIPAPALDWAAVAVSDRTRRSDLIGAAGRTAQSPERLPRRADSACAGPKE